MRRGATKDPERHEIPQFSLRAVFEAVVNAVAHRDYSIHGSKIRLFVFDDAELLLTVWSAETPNW
jgi:predicted HTH transcriptional regulator